MKFLLTLGMTGAALLMSATGPARAEDKAEIVSTATIREQADRLSDPDLIRFNDQWFVAYLESATGSWTGGVIRLLTSSDGKTWESVARIQSPTEKRGLYSPRFTRNPDGRLMLTATGVLPYPDSPDPLPQYGGLLKTLTWHSQDGLEWGKPTPIGRDEFPFGRVVWHNGRAYGCAHGHICGSVQTVRISGSRDGQAFDELYEETFSGFMPYETAFLFDKDKAWCLMNRSLALEPEGTPGYLGTSKAPYTDWTWKKMDRRIREPNLIRMPDKRVIATVGLFDRNVRTSLCEFDQETGRFTELLNLPTGKQPVFAGLAWHDGHVWATYPVTEGDKTRIECVQVKLP